MRVSKKQLERALERIERLEEIVSTLLWYSHDYPRQMALDFDQKTMRIRKAKEAK